VMGNADGSLRGAKADALLLQHAQELVVGRFGACRAAANRAPKPRAAGASLRTAAPSANRIELQRKPFPSSHHTGSGAVTTTSVVPSAHSSGSRIPAPVSSVCNTRKLLSTSQSARSATPRHQARVGN
jgi:hypothetical protein